MTMHFFQKVSHLNLQFTEHGLPDCALAQLERYFISAGVLVVQRRCVADAPELGVEIEVEAGDEAGVPEI